MQNRSEKVEVEFNSESALGTCYTRGFGRFSLSSNGDFNLETEKLMRQSGSSWMCFSHTKLSFIGNINSSGSSSSAVKGNAKVEMPSPIGKKSLDGAQLNLDKSIQDLADGIESAAKFEMDEPFMGNTFKGSVKLSR